jgi:hypothetical protein
LSIADHKKALQGSSKIPQYPWELRPNAPFLVNGKQVYWPDGTPVRTGDMQAGESFTIDLERRVIISAKRKQT